MQSIFKKDVKILTSMSDNTGRLSVPHILFLFTDLATEHAADLNLGADNLAQKGVFWVATKIKAQILKRPKTLDMVTAATWPEAPGRIRCNRFYALSKNDEALVLGKSEWAAIDKDGRPHKLTEIYPNSIVHLEDRVCDEPFLRISDDFSNCEQIGTYTIKSTDIDIAQHMNNAAYIRALFGLFSCAECEEMNVKEVEIFFKAQSYEGDNLTVYCRETENGKEYGMFRSDGVLATVVVLK